MGGKFWGAGRKATHSKYRAKRTEVDGITFASKKEAKRYGELKALARAGALRSLELQVEYRLEVDGDLICKYVADFRYFDFNLGRMVVEDVKGFKTSVYRIKKKLMKAIHGIDIYET